MVTDVEIEVHQANTTAWIESDPVVITLTRSALESDGAGGFKPAVPTALAAQTFRMDRASMAGIRLITTEQGTQVPDSFRIVGEPGADVMEGDDFEVDGRHFQVIFVSSDRYGRTAAEVEYRG